MQGRAPLILATPAATLTLAPGAKAAEGSLDQLAGTAGCVTETGRSSPADAATPGQCADGRALAGASSLGVSPDGRNVYVTDFSNRSISVFSRNTTTGALTQLPGTLGCVSENGEGVFGDAATAGQCSDGALIAQVGGIVVSPR